MSTWRPNPYWDPDCSQRAREAYRSHISNKRKRFRVEWWPRNSDAPSELRIQIMGMRIEICRYGIMVKRAIPSIEPDCYYTVFSFPRPRFEKF